MSIVLPKQDKLRRLRRKYGQDFPDLSNTDKLQAARQWKKWLESQREGQENVMRDRRLHWSRHRNFRIGNQHISTRDGRTWREPNADKNVIRSVINLIGPSLDFRLGVLAEQRPGFRHELLKATIEAREKAEAQQAVAEHYFHKLNAWVTMRDALYHAQTDGVCFVHNFVNKLAGPKMLNARKVALTDPRAAGLLAQGYTQEADGMILIPLSDSGDTMPPDAQVSEIYSGDLSCRIVLAHDTFVDPEARCLNGSGERAKWFAIRRPRDIYSARIEANNPDLQAEVLDTISDPTDYPMDTVQYWSRGLPPFPVGHRSKFKEATYEWMIYVAPDGEDIERGLWVRLIGDTLVDGGDELPGGVFPFARFTDGSPDPSFYPRPMMSDWVGDQITVNALASLITAQTRTGIGRLMALKGTLLTESYTTVAGSLLEYEGIKPEQLRPQTVGSDAWQLLQFAIRKLEDKTGWNDLARGQVLGQAGGGMQDVSGRAVLGAREMLERTFGPMVQAAAEGATEWAEVVVKMASWLYGDTPRMIPTVGGRGDLAKQVTREQLEGDCSVYVDPATLMPQPAQLRQQTLLDLLQRGWITLAEYQKRAPYAEIRNVYMGDIDHFQRAQWINTLLEQDWERYSQMQPVELYSPETGLPVLWQDDPGVHLTALNELLLNERKPWALRKLASDRSTVYEQLAQAKADPMQPVPMEVIGVPLNRLQASIGSPPQLVPTPVGAAAVMPGNAAQPATSPVPGLSPVGAPSASTDTAQPLGTLGQVEAGSQAQAQQ